MRYFRHLFLILMSTVLFLSALFTMPIKAAHNQEEEPSLKLYAASAVLMDARSGRILYEKNGHQIMPMASTTKIMTCILALEYGCLSDYAKASSYAAGMPKVKLGVKAEEYFVLEDLLYSLMLESHNDAAVVIAEHIAGSTEAFADMMNQKARDIGCFDTFFITPNGLDASATDSSGNARIHSTTAADLAKIMSYCITVSPQKEKFLEITRTSAKTIQSYGEKDGEYTPTGRSFSLNNHNAFLTMMDGAQSGKTGFTNNAGYCYVGSLQRDGRTYVVALLACGWPSHKTYKWSDTALLMNYGLENYENHMLSEYSYDESRLKPIPVTGGQTKHIGETAYTNVKIEKRETSDDSLLSSDSLLLRKDETIQVKCELKQSLSAPVSAGTEVGCVKYLLNDEIWHVEYILTADDVPAIDLPWCLMQILNYYFL